MLIEKWLLRNMGFSWVFKHAQKICQGICYINVCSLFFFPACLAVPKHTHILRSYSPCMGKNPLSPSNIHPGKLLNDFLSVPAVCSGWLQVDRASQESLGLKRLQGPQIYRREGEWMVTCWCCTQYVKIPLRESDTPPKPQTCPLLYMSIFLPLLPLPRIYSFTSQPLYFRDRRTVTFCTLCRLFRKQLWKNVICQTDCTVWTMLVFSQALALGQPRVCESEPL